MFFLTSTEFGRWCFHDPRQSKYSIEVIGTLLKRMSLAVPGLHGRHRSEIPLDQRISPVQDLTWSCGAHLEECWVGNSALLTLLWKNDRSGLPVIVQILSWGCKTKSPFEWCLLPRSIKNKQWFPYSGIGTHCRDCHSLILNSIKAISPLRIWSMILAQKEHWDWQLGRSLLFSELEYSSRTPNDVSWLPFLAVYSLHRTRSIKACSVFSTSACSKDLEVSPHFLRYYQTVW